MNRTILARNIMLLSALEDLCLLAEKHNLQFILLKGAALLSQKICAPWEREMTDLDLFVRCSDLNKAEILLSASGFSQMENSSQAHYKLTDQSAPPVIVDLHTGLWHEKNINAFFTRTIPAESHKNILLPSLPDQLLHLASHSLLYHGELTRRSFTDMACLLSYAYRQGNRDEFWAAAGEISADNRLAPVIKPVLRRVQILHPELINSHEAALFNSTGLRKIKELFFEFTADIKVKPLEYLRPAIYRPELFLQHLFPGKTFLARRYGRHSPVNLFRRPFQLLRSVFTRQG